MKKINTEIIVEREVEDVRELEGTIPWEDAGFVYCKSKKRVINYISCWRCKGFTVNIFTGECDVCKEERAEAKD
jgi:hypothetical protein